MPLGTGSVSLRRLQVLEEPRKTPLAWIFESLSKNLITPIGIDEDKEEASGWCHPFTGEPVIDNPFDLTFENAFVFGMRTDVKKIPGTLFRLQMKAALESLLSQTRSGEGEISKRIPKRLKDAARDRIRSELLKHTLPAIRLVEVAWHLDSNEIWLTSTSKAALDLFDKLFAETFALPLVQINPGTGAIEFSRLGKDSDYNLEMLRNLVPIDILQYQSAAAAVAGADSESVQPF